MNMFFKMVERLKRGLDRDKVGGRGGQPVWDSYSLVTSSIRRTEHYQVSSTEGRKIFLCQPFSCLFLLPFSVTLLSSTSPFASIILNHQGVKYNKALYRSICRLFLKGALQVNIPLACEKWAYLQQMTLMNLSSQPTIILFQLASPAKLISPAQICLAEGRVSLIQFPPDAPASCLGTPLSNYHPQRWLSARIQELLPWSSNASPCLSKSESS